MYTIFTEIDELDGNKDGNVTTAQFVEAIITRLGVRSQLAIDFEFLSLKYRHLDSPTYVEREQVWYKMFYNDYEYLDNYGLGSKIFGLAKDLADDINEPNQTTSGSENPFKFIIPQKFIDFYLNIEKWMAKRRATDRFISELLMHDQD